MNIVIIELQNHLRLLEMARAGIKNIYNIQKSDNATDYDYEKNLANPFNQYISQVQHEPNGVSIHSQSIVLEKYLPNLRRVNFLNYCFNIETTYIEAYSSKYYFSLGVSFAPRIKKIGSQRLYSVDSRRNYSNQDYKTKHPRFV